MENCTQAANARAALIALLNSGVKDDIVANLAELWPELSGGNAEGMRPDKLYGRMKEVEWTPPILSFDIERHGRTALGSTRAERHRWTVNLDQMTADCALVGYPQVKPKSPPLKVDSIVKEIATLIDARANDPRLAWKDSNTVRVLIGKIIPGSRPAQTVQDRRRRFRNALLAALGGWERVGLTNTLRRKATS